MAVVSTLAVLLVIIVSAHVIATTDEGTGKSQTDILHRMSRQMMLQQLFVEERIRSEGGSGIKQMRLNVAGTRPYYSATYSARAVAAIHDHANYVNTIGMGEVIAVLNGVEFRTRHNDYKLNMPSRTSKAFHATEDIPFPEVPPEVLKKRGVENEVEEMKKWFKAFKDQDYSVRDYRKYFKPVLCYMEGAWTTHTEGLEESFDSERHSIDASSWLDLQEKIRFTSATGTKSNLENFAYLPTTIINVTNGEPILAQWNYRILCHPLKDDLPLNRFRVVDDLAARMMYKRDLNEHSKSRAARFQINPFDTDEWKEGKERDGLLDELMEQIPGVDNYPGDLYDDAFDILAHKPLSASSGEDTVMNTAYYHRWFKVTLKGAMGLQVRHRSYSDPSIFMAMTSNPAIPEICYEHCTGRKGHSRYRCSSYCQRWTYAIPLEIIYLTPLSRWNPHNIKFKGAHNSDQGKTVRANGRNGQHVNSKAYDGINDHTYYMTPKELFVGRGITDADAADTSNKNVAVLNRKGEMVMVGPSGFRIMFNVADVGPIRLRYPIMPVHNEGSVFWKELEALKDIVLAPKTYGYLFHEPVDISLKDTENNLEKQGLKPVLLQLTAGPLAEHYHDLELSGEELLQLKQGNTIFTTCEEADGHSHNIQLRYDVDSTGKETFFMKKCDKRKSCEHPNTLYTVP